MKILLLNHYAGSPAHGLDMRSYHLARQWVMDKHDVTIVASSFTHLRLKNPEVPRPERTEDIDGIHYVWLRGPTYSAHTGLARVGNVLSFAAGVLQRSGQWAQKINPDLVIAASTYPFDIVAGKRIARLSGARLAVEVHDLWPETPIQVGGMSRYHPFAVAAGLAERYAYKVSDHVVSTLPAAEPHMRKKGLGAGKFRYVTIGTDLDQAQPNGHSPPSEIAEIVREARAKKQMIVCYAGTHTPVKALDVLLDAAALVREEPVFFLFVGQGPEKERLKAFAAAKDLRNVRFASPVSQADFPATLASCDVLYLGWLNLELYMNGISPNKLPDYMMSGRPILHSVRAGNDPVKEARCGISVPPEDPRAVADAVRAFLRLPPEQRDELGNNGRRYAREHYDYARLARKFLEDIC